MNGEASVNKEIGVKHIRLEGKKLIFLGSSVTYGHASNGVSFVEDIGARNGCSVRKEAVSGTTLVDDREDSYIARMKQIDQSAADLFVCQLSTNDASKGKALGAVSPGFEEKDFDTSTVAGAIEYIIAYARKKWNCPVAFYTSPKFDSEAYAVMVSLLYAIQKKWKIAIIDMWSDGNFNNITAEQRARYMADPVHPTRSGYLEWFTPYFESSLSRIIAEED